MQGFSRMAEPTQGWLNYYPTRSFQGWLNFYPIFPRMAELRKLAELLPSIWC